MSGKGKSGKDKKKQGVDSQSQKIIQQQKRQILQQTFTIKKLQDRLSRLTQQNYQIVSTKDHFHSQYQQRLDKTRILIQSHQHTIKQKSTKIYQLQVQKINLMNRVGHLDKQLKQSQANRVRQFEEYKRITQGEMQKLENQLKDFNFYMGERENMETENGMLKRTIEEEKETKVREVADKEREKVQATDKLRDQMLTKIRDMRSNLLSLKKEQLSTTTRLAVLQNHQLTSELEFQSKQSQKLIFQNQSLQKKVSNLAKDLQIHKQIQEQLAKRSHYSRGIIKKLTAKIGQLQEQIQQLKSSTPLQKKPSMSQQTSQNTLQLDKKQQMIKALDKSLQFTEKKFIKLQTQLETTLNENKHYKEKIEKYERKADGLILMLVKYYQEIVEQIAKAQGETRQELGSASQVGNSYSYDLKKLRNKTVEEWQPEQVKMIVNILLNQLAKQLNKRNLGIPNLNRNSLTISDDDQIQAIRFPRISEHSAVAKLSNIKSDKLRELPINMASKIVASNVRQWGRTVHTNSVSHLSRKYKIADR